MISRMHFNQKQIKQVFKKQHSLESLSQSTLTDLKKNKNKNEFFFSPTKNNAEFISLKRILNCIILN